MSVGSKKSQTLHARTRPRATPAQKIFPQILGFFCCVGLPVFMTVLAPVSIVRLTRQNDRVIADLSTHALYAIPYRHMVIEDVVEVDDRFHEGELVRDHDGNGRRDHYSESEAFLVVHGRDNAAEVPVSPINIRGARDKARAFLKAPGEQSLRIAVVANWKFGVVFPLLLSPLLVLYLVGLSMAVWRFVTRLLRPTKGPKKQD